MFDFDKAEFADAIAEYIPPSKRSLITGALDGTETDIEKLGRMFSGESRNTGFMVVTASRPASSDSIWGAVKAEIHDLFCTESKNYEEERKGGKGAIKKTIHAIAILVTAKFHIGLAVVYPIVTLGLMLALKIGKNVWCARVDSSVTPTSTQP